VIVTNYPNFGKLADLPQEVLRFLETECHGLEEYTVNLDYDYWTAGVCLFNLERKIHAIDGKKSRDDILQAILPEDLLKNSPTGFAITGHLGL